MATNVVGDSALSPFISITAAQKPDAPLAPELVAQDPTYITFDWFVPNNQFYPIQDYRVYWDTGSGSNVFSQLAGSTYNLTLWTKDNSNMP